MSPVRKKPSCPTASAVASGLFQYPTKLPGARISISPLRPGGSSSPESASRIRIAASLPAADRPPPVIRYGNGAEGDWSEKRACTSLEP